MAPKPEWKQSAAQFRTVERQLREYFQGKRTAFDVKLHQGHAVSEGRLESPRCDPVWRDALVRGYCEGGRTPGRRAAVGLATGGTAPIVVPCHRVIGASGKLVGYGGGLAVKQALLDRSARSA